MRAGAKGAGEMRPAFSYYGGKQRMSSKIVPLLPRHTVYVEPFAGGAAVFYAKPWPDVGNNNHYREVLNDTNQEIVNFYRVLRDQPDALFRATCLTPHSRVEHTKTAREPTSDPVERARRWFVDIQQSFANKSRGGWGTSVYGANQAATWQNACARMLGAAERLHSVHIECDDALRVIERWDSPQTLFYCDPPYPGTHQGHYSGYSQDDFAALVDTLNSAQGSFVLSCYDQPGVPDHWERFEFTAHASSNAVGRVGKGRDKSRAAAKKEMGDRKRTEVVWRMDRSANVRPEIKKLFDNGMWSAA